MLVLVFGAVVAGLVPLMIALVSIVVALGLVASLVAAQFSLSVFVVNMLTGMGLALGIDYSLFVVSRYREERTPAAARRSTRSPPPARPRAARCSSAARAFVVALIGMLLVPDTIMRSLAVGAIIVGDRLGGRRADAAAGAARPARRRRQRAARADRSAATSTEPTTRGPLLGRRSSARHARGPAVSLVLSAPLLLALAVPVLGLHIGASGVSTLPDRLRRSRATSRSSATSRRERRARPDRRRRRRARRRRARRDRAAASALAGDPASAPAATAVDAGRHVAALARAGARRPAGDRARRRGPRPAPTT